MTKPFVVLDPNTGAVRVLSAADVQALVLALTQGSIDGMPIGATTPAAGAFTTVAASDLLTNFTAGGLTAVGTNRATALALTAQVNALTTVGSGTGVVLPAAKKGRHITVFNEDATNAAKVYGAGTDTVDGAAAATGVTLSNTKRATFFCFADGAYVSAQLGAVSA